LTSVNEKLSEVRKRRVSSVHTRVPSRYSAIAPCP